MIKIKKGNLLKAETEALVNTVNCVGVMGKGIALQFKMAFPENFKTYKKACDAGELLPGKLHIYETASFINPKYIINFPTKRHWKGKSDINTIVLGLKNLREDILRLKIKSIAIPPLGCGNGGLNWNEIQPLIKSFLGDLENISIMLFAPLGAPEASTMPVGSKRPKMTLGRALIIKLMEKYAIPGYKLTLLEIQKLAYFLQDSGENLRLGYSKSSFGPYASNLNHVLQRINGHYINGYGDRSRSTKIYLLSGASELATKTLSDMTDSLERLEKVHNLIEGFENPYGMELLATVHWVLKDNTDGILSNAETVEKVFAWNDRKKKIFNSEHIAIARKRLIDEKWV
ncbi:MAG: macro domain-containing protein [candidate division Zixibacteria bacterium]